MQTQLITSILGAVGKQDYTAAQRQLEMLRASGCPTPVVRVINALIQHHRAPQTKTMRDLVRIQLETEVHAAPFILETWSALRDWPDLPSRMLRDYANFTLKATAHWSDTQTLNLVDFAGMVGVGAGDKQFLFDSLMVPIMRHAAQRGHFDTLLRAEASVYEWFIRSRDNEENFAASYQKLGPLLREAGIAYRRQRPPQAATKALPPRGRPRVAFFVHLASRLAHLEALRATLRGYQALSDRPFEPVVIVGAAYKEHFARDFAEIGIKPIFLLSGESPGPLLLLESLRRQLEELECTAVVFVSLILWMTFAFASRIAPVQVWWSAKYHAFETPEIDDYIAGGRDLTRVIHGRVWRTIPLALQDWFDPALTSPAAQIRAELGAESRVILGSISREEKLRSPEFLEAVCAILKRHPNCVFLWTGRTEDSLIAKTFVDAGLAGQTRFIGWVDTKLYAQVLDVFLDSFPAPAGFTAFQAMAAGKPIVFFKIPEASQGVQGQISLLYFGQEGMVAQQQRIATIFRKDSGRPLFLLASNTDEYVEFASRLISDVDHRREVGEACRTFIEEFVSDVSEVGAGFSRCISDILAAKLGSPPT